MKDRIFKSENSDRVFNLTRGETSMRQATANDGRTLNEKIVNLVKNLSDEKKQLLVDLLIEWQQKEQRSDSRIPCLIAVDYAFKKRAYRDFMQDLSKGGVFIETREPLNTGESITLTFAMPNEKVHFKIAGKIVRSENGGIGVQFDTKLSHYQEEIIKNAIGG